MRSHTIRKVENHYKPPLRVFHISHLKKEKKTKVGSDEREEGKRMEHYQEQADE